MGGKETGCGLEGGSRLEKNVWGVADDQEGEGAGRSSMKRWLAEIRTGDGSVSALSNEHSLEDVAFGQRKEKKGAGP